MDRAEKNAVYILVLALIVHSASHSLKRASCSEGACTYEIPRQVGQWSGTDIEMHDAAGLKASIGAQEMVFRAYRNGSDTVILYLAYYKDVNSADRVHAPGICYSAQGWTVRQNQIVRRALGAGHAMINRMVIERSEKRELVYNWWFTGHRVIPWNSINRLYQVIRGVSGRHSSTLWVRISIVLKGSMDRHEKRLTMFAKDLLPLLGGYFSES